MRTNCPDCTWHIQINGTVRIIKGYTPCAECRMATLHDLHLKVGDSDALTALVESGTLTTEQVRTITTWRWPEYSDYCFRCSKSMKARDVHPDRDGGGWPTAVSMSGQSFDYGDELQNECTLIFVGGYGSFIDDMGDMPSARICHECAHELCEFLGIDPRNWHTHSIYGGQHADHHDNRTEE